VLVELGDPTIHLLQLVAELGCKWSQNWGDWKVTTQQMAASSTGSGLLLPTDEARQQASEARHGGDGGDGVLVSRINIATPVYLMAFQAACRSDSTCRTAMNGLQRLEALLCAVASIRPK
jgi:hypothetical protein